jgi:general secretion pathway protein D
MDGVELDVASAEPLTLRFKDAKIKEVFKVLTKLTGINFILDEDVRDQPISVFLEQASFAQAMELILQMNGLEKKVLNSKTIVIYPQSRDKDKQYGDQIIQTFYLSHIDAKKAVNMLRTMLQLRKVYVHEERNALVVRDKPDVIRLAEQILDAADREDSEVIFNLELVSVSDTDSLKFGPELSTYSVGVGFSEDGTTIVKDTLGTTTDGLVQSLNNLQTFYTLPSATFNFAKTLSGTQILASPKIRVRNNEKGKVHVGTREPIVTTTTSDGGTVSENITYIDVGVKVDVEPNIQLGNSVETKLTLEVSQIIERLPPTSNGSIPLRISTTNAQTVLTLKDGVQTIIGGLFSQDESKSKKTVPWLGEIPVVGDLFGSLDNTDTKREILLSITPYIVKQLEVPGEDIATIWSGGEDNLKAGPNFGAFARPLESEVESVRPVAAPSLKQEPSSVLPAAKSFPGTADQTSVDSAVHSGTDPAPVESSGESAAGMTAFPASREAAPAEGSVIPAERRLPVKRLAGPVPLAELASPAAPVLALVGPRSAAVGEEFMLTVEVKNVASLYSAPLFVNYDPVRLSLQGVDEGGFLEEDGPGAVFSSNVKQDVGQIVVGYKQDAGGTGASGSGPLFILRFKTLAAGSALVDLNRINFRDPQGVRLDVQAANARIEIR